MKRSYGKLGRTIVLLLALALVLVPITGSLADIPTAYSQYASISVGKTLNTTTAGVYPNVTSFQFLLAPVGYTPGPTTGTTYTAANLPMPSGGTAGTPMAITVSGFSPSAGGTSQTNSTKTGDITYTQAGVYTYRLTERIPGTTDVLGTVPGTPVTGVTYDTAVYYVNVYVTNVLNDDGTPKLDGFGNQVVNVSAITAWETTNSGNLDPMGQDNGGNGPIVNVPGQQDTGKIGITVPAANDGATRNISYPFLNDYRTANMTVSKLVTGDMADRNQAFTFTAGLMTPGGASDTGTYNYQKYDMGTDHAIGGTSYAADTAIGTGTITNGGTFSLTHNQYIQIIGLPAGERVTTTEGDVSGYRTTITVQHGTPGTLTTVGTNLTTNRTTGQQIIAVGTSAVNAQAFTNNKESVTPTGVILNILPYVLLGVVAIILVVILLRKRK